MKLGGENNLNLIVHLHIYFFRSIVRNRILRWPGIERRILGVFAGRWDADVGTQDKEQDHAQQSNLKDGCDIKCPNAMKIRQRAESAEESVASEHGLSVEHDETRVACNDEQKKVRKTSSNGLALRAQRQHVVAQLEKTQKQDQN
jgi:hypothetical protein